MALPALFSCRRRRARVEMHVKLHDVQVETHLPSTPPDLRHEQGGG